jgi:pyruvate, orthophosphate dikinase
MTTQLATGSVKDSPGGTQKWVYDFADGSREMRDLLGGEGEGAGVAEMSIGFFHDAGLDNVIRSPFRLPIARVAAAQAAIADPRQRRV